MLLHDKALHLLQSFYASLPVAEPTISQQQQHVHIEALKQIVPYEQFFFVVNLLEGKIEHVHGVSEWLGYPDQSFTLGQYLRLIPEKHLMAMIVLAQSSLAAANSQSNHVQFMSDRVVVQLPIRHANDSYYLTKRTLYPFQIDKNGCVTSYLNHFVMLKPYEEATDGLEARTGSGIHLLNQKNSEVVAITQKELLANQAENFGLNATEMAILQAFANYPSLSQKEICEKFGFSYNSLQKTHNHRILHKIRNHFRTESFSNIKSAAMFLKKQGLL